MFDCHTSLAAIAQEDNDLDLVMKHCEMGLEAVSGADGKGVDPGAGDRLVRAHQNMAAACGAAGDQERESTHRKKVKELQKEAADKKAEEDKKMAESAPDLEEATEFEEGTTEDGLAMISGGGAEGEAENDKDDLGPVVHTDLLAASAEEEEGVRGSSTHVDLKNLKEVAHDLSAEDLAAMRAKTKSAAEVSANMTAEQQAAYGCKPGVAASAVRADSDDSDDEGADFCMGGEGDGALLGDY